MQVTVRDEMEEVVMSPYKYICEIPGKQIRTKLTHAYNHWLQIPQEKLKAISEVIQMLHNASILIDDIEDNSQLRRGVPVAHNVYGLATTINTANYIYFLALEKLCALGNAEETTRVFTEHLLDLHRGQGMDIYWRDNSVCPTEEEYKLMVILKTGALFSLALELLQVHSENKRNFKPLLKLLGLHFQIRDDYANLCSSQYEADKTYCEDLTEGKFSFPIIHAIHTDLNDDKVLNILRQKTEDRDLKKTCVEHMEGLGSFEYTRSVMRDLEKQLMTEISACGDNPSLVAIVEGLSKIYKESDACNGTTA